MQFSSYIDSVANHYSAVWKQRGIAIDSTRGRRSELPQEFRVMEFSPYEGRQMWTYATCGMSVETDEQPLELHLFSRVQSVAAAELLFMTAHFHRTASRLSLGHSVFFGKPWMDDSMCEYGLISLPYLDGPALENLRLPNGVMAKFLWLIPVTRAEIEYKKEFGLERLEQKFEAGNFDYTDPHRPSLCD